MYCRRQLMRCPADVSAMYRQYYLQRDIAHTCWAPGRRNDPAMEELVKAMRDNRSSTGCAMRALTPCDSDPVVDLADRPDF